MQNLCLRNFSNLLISIFNDNQMYWFGLSKCKNMPEWAPLIIIINFDSAKPSNPNVNITKLNRECTKKELNFRFSGQ